APALLRGRERHALSRGSAEELVDGRLVFREGPELRGLAVRQVPDVDFPDRQLLPGPLTVRGHEHGAMGVVRQDVVDVEAEGPAAQLHQLHEEAHDLLMPVIVPGSLVGPPDMPGDVMGKQGEDRVYVTSPEGLIPAPEQILVGMRHCPLLIVVRLIASHPRRGGATSGTPSRFWSPPHYEQARHPARRRNQGMVVANAWQPC